MTTARETIMAVYDVDIDEAWDEIMEGLTPWRDVANGTDVPPFLLGNPAHKLSRDALVALAFADVDSPEGFLAAVDGCMSLSGPDDERATRIALAIEEVCTWRSMSSGEPFGKGSEQLLELVAFLAWLTGRLEFAVSVLGHLIDIDPVGVESGEYDLGALVAHAVRTGTPPPVLLGKVTDDLATLAEGERELESVETADDVLRLLGIDPESDGPFTGDGD